MSIISMVQLHHRVQVHLRARECRRFFKTPSGR